MADQIDLAASKLLILLGDKGEEFIDDAAANTYEGSYWEDLVSGDAQDLQRCLDHNDTTYKLVVERLIEKLQTSTK